MEKDLFHMDRDIKLIYILGVIVAPISLLANIVLVIMWITK